MSARKKPASRRQGYYSIEEILLSSHSLSVVHVRTERLVNDLSSPSSSVRENPSQDSSGMTGKSEFSLIAEEIQKHEFQADSDRRSIQELNEIIESERREGR